MQGLSVTRPVMATFMLGLFFALHSLLFSPLVGVSLLKALSWTVAMCTVLAGWGSLDCESRERLVKWIFGLLSALLFVSLPLTVLPVGYLTNGTGFQGVLNQPQAYGTAVGLLGVWAASQMLALQRPPWKVVLLVLACLVTVALSGSRTGGFAMVLGFAAAVSTVSNLASRSMRTLLPGLYSRRVHLVLGLALVGVVVALPLVSEQVAVFVAKGTNTDSLLQAYDTSRGGLIEAMWTNIKTHPLRGIGFGIASHPSEMVIQRDPILGLPIGASIEKGVAPLAVLEETGLFGLCFVALWVWMLMRRAARQGVTALAVLMTILFMNLGEYTLFSAGGMGLLQLVLVGWCVSDIRFRAELDEEPERLALARHRQPAHGTAGDLAGITGVHGDLRG